jgi:hypothetical protein
MTSPKIEQLAALLDAIESFSGANPDTAQVIAEARTLLGGLLHDSNQDATDCTTTPAAAPHLILDLPMGRNDADAATIREYLIALLARVWDQCDDFSGKRPFGMSGWCYEVYEPLVRAGVVAGTIVEEDGCTEVEVDDHRQADRIIADAIQELGKIPSQWLVVETQCLFPVPVTIYDSYPAAAMAAECLDAELEVPGKHHIYALMEVPRG